MEELEKNGGLSDAQRSELDDVIGQIDYLNKAIDAIHQLGNDPNMFFLIKRERALTVMYIKAITAM